MLQAEAQRVGAITGYWAMTLQSIYEDQEVLNKVPLYKKVKPMLQTAVPRPVAPNYADISTAIQLRLRQALEGQRSPSDALTALASDLRSKT